MDTPMVVGANKPSVVRKGRALHIKHFCVHNAIAISFTAHIQIFLALHKAAGVCYNLCSKKWRGKCWLTSFRAYGGKGKTNCSSAIWRATSFC